MKKLYFVATNGYDMVVSVDENNNCRYLTETADFPNMTAMTRDEKKAAAVEFLNAVEDDSSWNDDCSYEDIFNNDAEIIADAEKYL